MHRHRAALVCRRWASLVNAPQLLADIKITASSRRLRSFSPWVLERAAGHVQSLTLELKVEGAESFDSQEALATAVACATACCAAGGLQVWGIGGGCRLAGHLSAVGLE